MNDKSPGHPGRLDFVDSLRGLAICGVVMIHVGQKIPLPPWLGSMANYGGFGVELFFMLSALTLITVNHGKTFRARSFFIRRIFRLAPMFYFGILLYCALRVSGVFIENAAPLEWHQLLLTFTFLHEWWPDSVNNIVPGGWSIGNEAMFYCLFPFLLRFLTNWTRLLVTLLLAVIVSRWGFTRLGPLESAAFGESYAFEFAAFSFPVHVVDFLAGFVAFRALEILRPLSIRSERVKKFASFLCFLIPLVAMIASALPYPMLHNPLMVDPLILAFIVAVGIATPRIWDNRFFRAAGIISYSVYIVHFAILYGLNALFSPALNAMGPYRALPCLYAGTLAISFAVATLTHRWIEIPFIRWGKQVSDRAAHEYRPEANIVY